MSLTKTYPKGNRTSLNPTQTQDRHANIRATVLTIAGGIIVLLGCVLGCITANPGQKRYEILSPEAFKVLSPAPESFIPTAILLILGTALLMTGMFHFIDIASLASIVLLVGIVIIGVTTLGAMPQTEAQQAFNQWLAKDAHLNSVNTSTSKVSKNGISIPVQKTTEPVLMQTKDNKLVFVTFHTESDIITYSIKPAKQ